MLRRRAAEPSSPPPPWRDRFDRACELIESQRPPVWMSARLLELEQALIATEDDRQRLGAALAGLDVERAGAELKTALRSPDPSAAHQRLVDSLRERYESMNQVVNRHADLGTTIERSLIDLELLAAKSVELGADAERWALEQTVDRLTDDMHALELAHREIAGPPGDV